MTDASELEYVGFWARVWASIIDTVLMLVILIPLGVKLFGSSSSMNGMMGGVMSGAVGTMMDSFTLTGWNNTLFSYVLPGVIVVLFWSFKDATPGKMVIGARIVDASTGASPNLWQHVLRYLGYFVSIFPFCLGLIWVGIDPRKQGWHDKLANTVVVRTKNHGTQAVHFK